MPLQSKSVLITGSSRGLGMYLAIKFDKEGHNVILTGRNEKDLKSVQSQLKNDSVIVVGDLRDYGDLLNINYESRVNNVSVLINNAGVVCPGLSIDSLKVETITEMIDVNLLSPIVLTKLLYDKVDDIININSMVGLEPKKHRTIYGSTKFGLKGFSDSLRLESDKNIVDVYPTRIQTYPERKNCMDIKFVCDKIYESYSKKLNKDLILDGRLK
mgnify:FL=1